MNIPLPFHRLLLTAGILSTLSLPCHAARKARAIFIQPPDASVGRAILFTGSSYAEIELPQRYFSPEVKLPDGDLTIAILAKEPARDEPVPAEAQKILIPDGWSRCLLLFFPDPSNKVFPAKVVPVNASIADFPMGHTVIYNVSAATVTGRFGKELVSVKPGQSAALKPPVDRFGDYPVAIDCMLPGETEPSAICRSTWQHNPDARQILFVTPQPGYKVPRVWGILDRQDEEKKKDK